MKSQQATMEINLVTFRREIGKHHLEDKLYVALEAVRNTIDIRWNLFSDREDGFEKNPRM